MFIFWDRTSIPIVDLGRKLLILDKKVDYYHSSVIQVSIYLPISCREKHGIMGGNGMKKEPQMRKKFDWIQPTTDNTQTSVPYIQHPKAFCLVKQEQYALQDVWFVKNTINYVLSVLILVLMKLTVLCDLVAAALISMSNVPNWLLLPSAVTVNPEIKHSQSLFAKQDQMEHCPVTSMLLQIAHMLSNL